MTNNNDRFHIQAIRGNVTSRKNCTVLTVFEVCTRDRDEYRLLGGESKNFTALFAADILNKICFLFSRDGSKTIQKSNIFQIMSTFIPVQYPHSI